MSIFDDRTAAGQCLANKLTAYQRAVNTLVLALPRGGVPVAFEIAKALRLPLDVFLVRKLGTPDNEELAMGAIASDHTAIFNDDIIESLGITKAQIETAITTQKAELARRNQRYRQGKPPPVVKQQSIILVDDGIATGATVKAALLALKKMHPAKLILAVPVAAASSLGPLTRIADEVICPFTPEPFYGVGQWYQQFPQTSDEEVCRLLEQSKSFSALNRSL